MIHIDKLLEKESRLPRAINNKVVGKIGGRRKQKTRTGLSFMVNYSMKIIIIYLSFIFDLCKNPSNICSGGNIIQYDLFWLLVALRRNMGFLTWQSIVFNQQTIEEEGDFLEANLCRCRRWLKKSFRILMTHIFASHSSKC